MERLTKAAASRQRMAVSVLKLHGRPWKTCPATFFAAHAVYVHIPTASGVVLPKGVKYGVEIVLEIIWLVCFL